MIHVIFSSSAAGTLRQLLHARGLKQPVVDLSEPLDWGPITAGNFADREKWLDHHVPADFGTWDWIGESVAKFRERVAVDSERLIWIAPRSAHEQAGLYWYLDQFEGADVQMVVVDYALQDASRSEPPFTLGQLGQVQMAEILDHCPRLAWDSSRFPSDRWQALIADDSLLRIVDEGALRSASENYFDQFLLGRCSTEWAKWHYVVGGAMADIWDIGHDTDDAFLLWRLRELIKRGDIACNGELPHYAAPSRNKVMVRRAR